MFPVLYYYFNLFLLVGDSESPVLLLTGLFLKIKKSRVKLIAFVLDFG
jgi:hypothetical protein